MGLELQTSWKWRIFELRGGSVEGFVAEMGVGWEFRGRGDSNGIF